MHLSLTHETELLLSKFKTSYSKLADFQNYSNLGLSSPLLPLSPNPLLHLPHHSFPHHLHLQLDHLHHLLLPLYLLCHFHFSPSLPFLVNFFTFLYLSFAFLGVLLFVPPLLVGWVFPGPLVAPCSLWLGRSGGGMVKGLG